MTVHELIESLQFCNAPDAEVVVEMAGAKFEIVRASYDESVGPVWIEVEVAR